jgi:hypothetical protein
MPKAKSMVLSSKDRASSYPRKQTKQRAPCFHGTLSACSISVSRRLPAIALSAAGTTATAATESTATGTLLHRFRFIDR